MKMITLTCDGCGKKFERLLKEYTRSQKRGRKNYCGYSCSGKSERSRTHQHLIDYWKNHGQRCWRDELSPFRKFFRSIKSRNREHGTEFNVTEQTLKDQWDKQSGICPYTGFKMILPETTGHKVKNPIYAASLDRIDSSRGYIDGNIEFTCRLINYAKNNFSKEEVLDFIKAVKNHK